MCLLIYSDVLPRMIHDEVMKVLESPVGQQAENLADALFRTMIADGRNALEALHHDGFIKKVQTSQVIVTPTPTSTIRLDELNNLLNEMAKGEDAVKKLAEMDNNAGITNYRKKNVHTESETKALVKEEVKNAPTPSLESKVLSDDDIRKDLRRQALKMRQDAKQLISEAQRLEIQARDIRASLKAQNGKTVPIKEA